jgi:beta-glucosidase
MYENGCHVYNQDNKDIEKAIRKAAKADAVVAVVGDTTSLYGECLDRADLNLTGAQNELLEALKDTGKPLVVVLINGKPLTIPWVKEHADAIVEAWNPGMEGGKALASILFGDYNPCAKLTISFPEHIGQLPVYYNQLPGWHTDRYQDMTAKPLFPFGYGLSYTTYKYSNFRIEKEELKADNTLKVYVDVENTGDREGVEIVQAYINDKYSSVTTPIKELKGFTRLQLEPGEKKTAEIDIPVSSLSIVNRDLKEIVEPGHFELMVGSSSKDKELLKRDFTVIDNG